jgi:ubiquinone/menaquinone biosynthesis C-methylase UbiE
MGLLLTWRDVIGNKNAFYAWRDSWKDNPIIGPHRFQNEILKQTGKPILNVASSEDPAELGKNFGAINLDIVDFDPTSGNHNSRAPNFVEGSAFDIPFEDGKFETVVLGEFIEHCKFEDAVRAVRECKRVMSEDGALVITVPLDGRPKEEQRILDVDRNAGDFYTNSPCTYYHQTWWSNEMLDRLWRECGLIEEYRTQLYYTLTCMIGGWGLVLRKE